jgi:hypothetical protein
VIGYTRVDLAKILQLLQYEALHRLPSVPHLSHLTPTLQLLVIRLLIDIQGVSKMLRQT